MSGIAPIEPDADEEWEAVTWQARPASHADVPAVAAAVSELLVELGGKPAAIPALEEATKALIDDPHAGAVLVVEDEGEIVGTIGVSWQHAIRIPGRYGLIQELWVHPNRRTKEIGGDLLLALFWLARERGIGRIEVGLPSERFPHLAATESFYVNNGFATIGVRMRRLV
jgi:branched-chain amino acid aminotransferase